MIIGKLIPAGTGMPRYREIDTEAPDYEPLPFYSSEVDDDLDLAEWLRGTSGRRRRPIGSPGRPRGAAGRRATRRSDGRAPGRASRAPATAVAPTPTPADGRVPRPSEEQSAATDGIRARRTGVE